MKQAQKDTNTHQTEKPICKFYARKTVQAYHKKANKKANKKKRSPEASAIIYLQMVQQTHFD